MITVSEELWAVLEERTFRMTCQIAVTYGGAVLLDSCPVISGTEEFDATIRVPERVQVTVPRIVDGVDMAPTDVDSPFAPYGQRLHVKLGIGVGRHIEWINRGEFLIQSTRVDNDQVVVTAVGLLALIDEARLAVPWTPSGTLTTSLRKLFEPAVTVVVDPAVTALDRAVPSSLAQDEDRLQAGFDILDAWPARAQVTAAGYLAVMPANYYPPSTVLQRWNFVDDAAVQDAANIIEAAGSITRDGLYNTVVARGVGESGTQVTGVVYDSTPGGPISRSSPFNPLPVPYFFYSPLLANQAQCLDAAAALLQRLGAAHANRIELTAIPDPRICGNDNVDYRPQEYTDRDISCVVERLVMPYTAGSGPMSVTLREI